MEGSGAAAGYSLWQKPVDLGYQSLNIHAAAPENAGMTVNARLVRDGGHGAEEERFTMLEGIEGIL